MMREMRNPPNPTHAQQLVALRTGRDLPELLQELYVRKRLSTVAIATELEVSRNTVGMWLREFGIVRSGKRAAA